MGSAGNALGRKAGLCESDPLGCYRELTPHEFNDHKAMSVLILKDESALEAFQGYASRHYLPDSSHIEALLADWPLERVIGLACPDGECSSRLAIRLSRQGYSVYHLAGGLKEWQNCTWD